MKDLLTLIVSAAVMMGIFMYLLIGTFPPVWVTMCIVAVGVLWLMKGVIHDYIR